MSGRGRDRGRGGVPPHSPLPLPPTIEQLMAVQTQLMQALVQNQQNQPIGGAPRDKRGEVLKGCPRCFLMPLIHWKQMIDFVQWKSNST